MKKYLVCLFVSATVVSVIFSGCKKNSNTAVKPDVSNFWVDSESSFVPGQSATVTVNSTSLASGTYTVNFNCPGRMNSFANQSATLIMNNHTGVFQTPVFDSPYVTRVTIDSITNSDGVAAVLTNNNVAVVADSLGLMTATISGSSPFRAVSVSGWLLSGIWLEIIAGYSSPVGEEIITFTIINNGATGSFNFYTPAADSFSVNGGASIFQNPRGGNNAIYGQVIITTLSPLATGSFSFTCADSTKVAGSYSCPAL